jgi:hypothetical protein
MVRPFTQVIAEIHSGHIGREFGRNEWLPGKGSVAIYERWEKIPGLEMLRIVHDKVIRSQLQDGSRIGVIRYKKSGSSPSVSGTTSPGFKDSLSLKRTFSESTAETPSSR